MVTDGQPTDRQRIHADLERVRVDLHLLVAGAATPELRRRTNGTRWTNGQQGVVSGAIKEPGPPAVGSHCQMVRRIGGADRPSTSVLTKLDPPTSWAVRGIDGPIRASVDVTVEPIDEARSRVSIDLDFEGHGIGRVLVPLLVRRQAAKEMPENIRRLKDRIEAQPGHPS